MRFYRAALRMVLERARQVQQRGGSCLGAIKSMYEGVGNEWLRFSQRRVQPKYQQNQANRILTMSYGSAKLMRPR